MNHHVRLILHLLLAIVAGGSALQSQAQWQTEYRGLGVQSLDLQLLQTAKQDWHANQLRYMMAPEWVASKNGITLEQAWTNMLNALPQQLDNAHALGISVIVDLHQLPAVSPNEPYAGDKEALSHAWWTDSGNRDIMVAAWRELSQITAARTNQKIWLELYNEPLDWVDFPSYPTDWPSWAQTLIDEIRTNDMAHPIVIQTGPGTLPWGLATWPGLVDPSTNDLIYSIHQYNPISYSHQGVSSSNVVDWSLAATGWDKNRIRTDELQYAKDYQDTHGVRIHVGEFSAPRWAPNADKYIRDQLELFEEYGWDWNYHAFDAAKVWNLKYPEQVDLYDTNGTYVRTGIADPDEGLFYPPYGTPPLVALEKVTGFTKRGELVLEYLSRNLDDGPVPGENLAMTNGLWTDAAIWDQGYVPDTTDDRARIWANHTVTVDSVVATAVSNIRLGSMLQEPGHLVIDQGAALTNNGQMQISGGVSNSAGSSVTINGTYHNGGNMDVGHVSSTGQGGRLFINTGAVVTVDGVINVGLGSTGTVTMTGGTVVQNGAGNNGDAQIGVGERQYGELDMSGGTWTTGDDLIVGGGAGNNRTGKAVFSGSATMAVIDDVFIAGFSGREDQNGEVIVNDALLDVGYVTYVGRANTCTGTLTLAHADAQMDTGNLFVAFDGGKGTVNLLNGELFVTETSSLNNDIQIGANGTVNFGKGVLKWADSDGTTTFKNFWVNGDFVATKSDANHPVLTNGLDTITYSQDLGDDFTAWVGLDGGVAKTFVTAVYGNTAASSGSWTNAAIWDYGHIPNLTDALAFIWNNSTVTVDSIVAQAVSSIRLGENLSDPGHLVIASGAALTNNGLLEISGGTATVGSSVTINGTYHNGGNMDVGYVSSNGMGGRLIINSGADVAVNGVIHVGLGSTGTVTMTGGTVVQTGSGDTSVGAGGGVYGELNMSGGTWTTGDDLIVGAENACTGKATLSGGATMEVSDDMFLAGLNLRNNANGEVEIYDATLDVYDALYVGRANSCTGILTLAHADSRVETWWLYVANGGGEGTVNLLDGELFLRGNNLNDNLLSMGNNGTINFEKGVLSWNDNTTANELEQFWTDGDFAATKNGANPENFTNTLDSIVYTGDLGDGYTAWVGLDGGVAKTFVTTDNPLVVVIGNISISIDGTHAIINWIGTDGANYTLQSKTDITNSWSNEQTDIPGVDGSMSATSTTDSAKSFYRIFSP